MQMFNIVINFLVGDMYMMFVSVISDNLYRNLLYRGGINLLIGGILYIIYYFLDKNSNIKYS